jgi:hypothetical protein
MSEVTDLVLPILQRMQSEMSGLRAKVDDIAERQLEQGEMLEEMKGYMTFHMGITMQHMSDLADIKKRLTVLEQAP